MQRRAPPREARDGQIKTAPEKMRRTDLPDKSAAKHRKDTIGLQQRPPKSLYRRGVVRTMSAVFNERNRICHFVRQHRDADL